MNKADCWKGQLVCFLGKDKTKFTGKITKLNGKSAMVRSVVGSGSVYLYGFRPQYRGQSMATQPLIWYAMVRGKI